ncbi:hypothetical protein [Actibacterium sp. 188UL27-1]|uniref:hypothetical protein n=1 Tax=Actibacterium sp. 188UL27-1 TaxID=2786961 RepID=UPI001958C651|nr:hypothetical protein [Actibacterium sp. 188UL27-1]MBM7069760.1 hypothetical protein [Actibacterium sp. 188UL27-1]
MSAYDRRKLTIAEVVVRFVAAFAMLVPNVLIHLSAIATGMALIAWDIREAKRLF